MGKWENFTTERVASFKCQPGKSQSIYWDGKATGLGLRVTAAGAKSYIFEAWMNGRSLRMTIGSPDAWPLSKAQPEARRLKALTDRGIDPRLEKVKQREKLTAENAEAKRHILTLGEAWREYLKARKAKWSERTYRDHVRLSAPGGVDKKVGKGLTIAAPLAALMSLRLSDLTAEKMTEWIEKESETRPTSAGLSFRLLQAFINWADDHKDYKGLVSKDVCKSRALRDTVPKRKTKEGDSLQREQLEAWFTSVRKMPNPVISAYLQGLLITGARREEMAAIRWTDVDFQWRSITIHDKVEGKRVIPLPPYLASLLAALPRRNEWVFSSPAAKAGNVSEPRHAHNHALAAAGLPHITLHGLRRSFGTLCEWVEVPSGISAQIMGHKPSALAEKHYRRRPIDLLRKWHDVIEAWILEQAGIEFVPAVPTLKVVSAI